MFTNRNITTTTVTLSATLADVVTPVSLYLKLRDIYPGSVLLESSDYHLRRGSMSYICMMPLVEFIVDGGSLFIKEDNSSISLGTVDSIHAAQNALHSFMNSMNVSSADNGSNGLFGYMSFDAVRHFDSVPLSSADDSEYHIPEIHYALYGLILAFNHSNNTITLTENLRDGDVSSSERLISLLHNRAVTSFHFHRVGEVMSNISDADFVEMVRRGKYHCQRGDVFQIVLSRQFSVAFEGDEFNVYRALRQINPSPYLFFFDYGSYRIFGSSPESQIIIGDGKAQINPIAGTFRRTGDDALDKQLACRLADDPKECAEHVMLVDLARNDLSRHCSNVCVTSLKEVQYFSHVLHMVSEVQGEFCPEVPMTDIVADSFPAGTLSGAPKHRALQLIADIENQPRGFYGGCIGFIGFNDSFNHAIMIRSFLSKGNRLFYQAGAGVVCRSVEENELQEVNNKLAALAQAITEAENY